MKELDIQVIIANTPQAKGRVERMNETLQDRMIKEMRLAKINSIEQADEFIKEKFTPNLIKNSMFPQRKKETYTEN